jgi:hypothetical protein
MTNEQVARIRAHQTNLDRYCWLLTTELTEIERQFVHKRISEERLELDRLMAEVDFPTADVFIAAQALAK